MTNLRQGSPEYIALLRSLRWPADEPPTWSYLDLRWRFLATAPNRYNLHELAVAAMALVAYETDADLDVLREKAVELHIGKNAGYAGLDQPDAWANFRMSEAFGVSPFDGVLVRMSDKYIRTVNLRRDPANEQVGESLMDTLFDLAAYALIAICLLEESAAA